MKFYGCKTVQEPEASTCIEDKTRDATKAEDYRHFAVDDVSDTVYFCDLNPYREGMFCYCSNRKDNKNTWIGE